MNSQICIFLNKYKYSVVIILAICIFYILESSLSTHDTVVRQGYAYFIKEGNNAYSRGTVWSGEGFNTYNSQYVLIKSADIDTFEIIGCGYAKDKNRIYYYAENKFFEQPDLKTFSIINIPQRIRVAHGDPSVDFLNCYAIDREHVFFGGYKTIFDPASFEILDEDYMKDSSHIFFQKKEIIGADATTFSRIRTERTSKETAFAKDKKHVYLNGFQILIDGKDIAPDSKSFVVLGYAYAKDKSYVYDIAAHAGNNWGEKIRIIEMADPETFKEISSMQHPSIGCGTGHAYAKDKSQVYFYNSILSGVDSASFELIDDGWCSYNAETDDISEQPIITKDKNCIYHNNEKVLDINSQCINPVPCTKDTLNTSCGIKDAEPPRTIIKGTVGM